MAMQSPVQVVVGVSGHRVDSAGIGVLGERFVRVDLPPTITAEHVALMQKDLALMAEIAQQHPTDLTELHNAAVRHDYPAARRLAGKVGLTERQLAARGGGQVGVALAIIVTLVIVEEILSSNGGGEPPPSPPPAEPTVGPDGGLPPGGVPPS
ncbi:MAG TPA: hypothetical protein VFR13_11015 [Jiangellaceae bacterium]|nr:hypothetical protein [Jiangellaceae bacterium]